MQFKYQARDLTGRIREGEIASASQEEAVRQLRGDGFFLLSIEPGAARKAAPTLTLFEKRVKRSEILYFTNQLAIMVDAGVPVANALAGIARQTENPTFKKSLETIENDVQAGANLSEALGKFPRLFDRTYVNLVKASEASGSLPAMLDRVALQGRRELETRGKVMGALLYPLSMMFMCVSVSVFLLAYVFPKITPMFASRNLELPAPTRVMMFLSYALTAHWPWFVAAVAGLAALVVHARRQRWGRVAGDWLLLHLPILGTVMCKLALSRSLRTLSTTINAGVPMLESIQLCGNVSSNVLFEESWDDVAQKVSGGKQICEALEGRKLFPATLLQMISSGESTGKLGEVLGKVSDYYDREVESSIKTATSLLEPIMVATMGGVIGTIALAMLLPIFKLSTSH